MNYQKEIRKTKNGKIYQWKLQTKDEHKNKKLRSQTWLQTAITKPEDKSTETQKQRKKDR